MENLNEQQIRDIVREEIQNNYRSGSPKVEPHTHNGTDNLPVSLLSINGFYPIPSSNKLYKNFFTQTYVYSFASPKTLQSPAFEVENVGNQVPALFPNVIIFDNTSGLGGGFKGGYAPEGTIILYQTPLTFYQLWARIGGAWRGVDLTLTVNDPVI